jgi:hypothetical protein
LTGKSTPKISSASLAKIGSVDNDTFLAIRFLHGFTLIDNTVIIQASLDEWMTELRFLCGGALNSYFCRET